MYKNTQKVKKILEWKLPKRRKLTKKKRRRLLTETLYDDMM